MLQFHYLSLVSYGKAIRLECRQTQRMLAHAKETLQREMEEKNQAQVQLRQSMERIKELEPLEAKLRKWATREPMITHYLRAYNEMTGFDIHSIQAQLAMLIQTQ